MPQWEYNAMYVQTQNWTVRTEQQGEQASEINYWEVLGHLGADGWELVGVVPIDANTGSFSGGTTMLVFYFKRPLPQ